MEQLIGSKLGKEYVKAVYCYPAYLTYMQSVVQSLSRVRLFATPWTASCQASLSFTISKSVNKSCENAILQNAGLDESQAGIRIAGKNVNNLRYAHDTTLLAESKEELKSLLMKVKESEKAGLNSTFKNLGS